MAALLGGAAAIMAVCASSGSVWADYQQHNPVAVEPEDFDGVDRLVSESAESHRSSAGGEFAPGCCPFAQVIDHPVNGTEAHREHRKQIW